MSLIERKIVPDAATLPDEDSIPMETASQHRLKRLVRLRYPLTSLLVVLIIWQIIGSNVNPIFLATPTKVAVSIYQLTISGVLPKNLWVTLSDFFLGLGLSVLVGIPLGLAKGRFEKVDKYSEVLVRCFYATPTIALFPLFILWFGIGTEFRIALVFFSAVFPLIINAEAGVRSVDSGLIEVATLFGAREREIFRKVVIPGAVPFIAAGFKIAIGRAIVTVVAIELLSSTTGLGGLMGYYGNDFETANYFAPLIATIIVSLIAFFIGDRIERHYLRWRPKAPSA